MDTLRQQVTAAHCKGSQVDFQCALLECGDRILDCSREEMAVAIAWAQEVCHRPGREVLVDCHA